MFHTIDTESIAKEVGIEMGDLPEIIIKKILDTQFRETARHMQDNTPHIIKLDHIGRFNNGRRKHFEEKEENKKAKEIEDIFKDYTFK